MTGMPVTFHVRKQHGRPAIGLFMRAAISSSRIGFTFTHANAARGEHTPQTGTNARSIVIAVDAFIGFTSLH